MKRKYLVTGGAGFIGSHLCDRLLKEDCRVTALDDLSLGREEFLSRARENPDFQFIRGDILDSGLLDSVFREGNFDGVFHLAANSDIRAEGGETNRDLKLTFLTTFSVLDAMRRAGVKKIVFASSSAIYGPVSGKISEDHGPLNPASFYGAAKLAGEAFISAFVTHFRMQAWIFRFPNVVGSRLTHGVVHDFIGKLRRDPTGLFILGDGKQFKPYLHVDDLIEAVLLCFRRQQANYNRVNVGVPGGTTVQRIAEIIVEEMGLSGVSFEYSGGSAGWTGDVPRYQYDLNLITEMGWKANFTSEEAIRHAVREYLGRLA